MIVARPIPAYSGLIPDNCMSLKESTVEKAALEWSRLHQGFGGQVRRTQEVDDRTARRHLNQFLKLGLVRQTGVGPSTEYQIK